MKKSSVRWAMVFWLLPLWVACARAATEKVVYSFASFPQGANPYGTLIRDASGNLYGTTYEGGAANVGTVFEVNAAGRYQVLYSFQGGADGANPYGGVVEDAAGNLYGTTFAGGASGKGTVFNPGRSQ